MFNHQSSSTTTSIHYHPTQVAAPYVSGVAYHWYAGDGWHELERLQDPNRVGSRQLVVVSQARVFFFHNPINIFPIDTLCISNLKFDKCNIII